MIRLKNIKYICAQPANDYYTWQVETMIHNFMSVGINPNNIEILLGYDNTVPPVWRKIQRAYPYVRFFFYEDTREKKNYIPSIYFHLMDKHLQKFPELEHETLFTHDSDIVFTRQPKWDYLMDDDVWYLSDTNSYLNYDYIMQKGEYILDGMCDIVGIDKSVVKENNLHSGGAQYIVKNTTSDFWNKVEKDAVKLYDYFNAIEPQWKANNPGSNYPIQKWTAGMWSYLWNGWYYGHEIKVHNDLSFGWVTNNIKDVEKHTILHNAGVTAQSKDLFFKGAYTNELPYNQNIYVNPNKASYFYYQQIQKAAQKSCLIN